MGSVASSVTLLISWLASNHGTKTTPRGMWYRQTALIRLHYVDGMNKETCPAIVCCGGRWDS